MCSLSLPGLEIENRDPINVICANEAQGQMKSGEQITKTPLKANRQDKSRTVKQTKEQS